MRDCGKQKSEGMTTHASKYLDLHVDEWDKEFTESNGFVYCLANQADPSFRVDELNKETGVLYPFRLLYRN